MRMLLWSCIFAASFGIWGADRAEILAKASDAELDEILSAAKYEDMKKAGLYEKLKSEREWFGNADITDRVLSEIVRRGGAAWEAKLKALYAKFSEENRFRNFSAVSVLTALRRMQKKPDPLQVDLVGTKEFQTDFPFLPNVEVALVNKDAEGEAFSVTRGGDYRSGRQARWRFEVLPRERTVPLPIRTRFGDGTGGGISSSGPLPVGETWTTVLNMSSFVDALEPGEYDVRVQYHDEHSISEMPEISGMIVAAAAPFKLVVKPMTVDATPQELKDVHAWLRAIPNNEPLKIVSASYSDAHHEFISPKTPQGKILTLGFPAVPALIDDLSAKDVSVEQKAWAFAMLFSITQQRDPREANGVLASYEYVEGGWRVAGGKGGNDDIVGFGLGGKGSRSGGSIDAVKQEAFAEGWRAWKRNIRVKGAEKN